MKIEVISPNDKILDFDCKNESINKYLKEDALKDAMAFLSKTYVLKEDNTNKVIGFFTLISSKVNRNEGTFIISREYKYSIPAILLGQLGIDKNYQGQGIGSDLLAYAIRTSLEITLKIGFTAIIIEADSTSLIPFYQKQGFSCFQQREKKLYISITEMLKNKVA